MYLKLNNFVIGSGVHVLKPKYTNNECAKNYLKYGGIKKHLLLKPNLKRLHCDTCSKSFKSKNFMRLHVGMHAVLGEIKLQGWWKCLVCEDFISVKHSYTLRNNIF